VDALDRRQLRPIEHPDLIRLGLPKDGGYVVPEACVRQSTVLLSLDRHAAIGCVVAEFHHVGRKTAAFNRAIAHLLERFRIVHVHGNNYSGYDPRIDFPDAVEITLVPVSLLAGPPVPSTRPLPRADLDRPNRPGRPDHPLRFN
jgi:hypothetical protein